MLFVFSKLKLKKWKKLTPDKRYNVFIAIEKKIAKDLGLKKPLKLEIRYDGDIRNCYGAFSTSDGTPKIIINENLLQ